MTKKQYSKANGKTYERQWDVPSDSDPSSYYTVSLTQEGDYVCHCWPFLRDRTKPCKHIRKVQAGQIAPRGQPLAGPSAAARVAPAITVSELRLTLANVRCVTLVVKKADAAISEVQVPQLPSNNEHFLLTVLYDLLQLGVAWPALQKRYREARDLSPEWVTQYITEYGRLIYGPPRDGRFQGVEYIPPESV